MIFPPTRIVSSIAVQSCEGCQMWPCCVLKYDNELISFPSFVLYRAGYGDCQNGTDLLPSASVASVLQVREVVS